MSEGECSEASKQLPSSIVKNKKAAHDHGIAIGPTCVLGCAKGIAIFKDEKEKKRKGKGRKKKS